jgi:Lar family restriction alleviation protein
MSELKSCPFCGNKVGAVSRVIQRGYVVDCDHCNISGPVGLTIDEAKAMWNRRAVDMEGVNLLLRKAICDKEAAIASANSQLDQGGWTSDWSHEFAMHDIEIETAAAIVRLKG